MQTFSIDFNYFLIAVNCIANNLLLIMTIFQIDAHQRGDTTYICTLNGIVELRKSS